MTDSRHDSPVSWNAGALYRLLPGVMPYFGVSTNHLANFNSENTQNGVGVPESAMQYETGVKFSLLRDRFIVNTAAFNITRDNVAALVSINGVETIVFDSQRTRGFEASLYASLTPQWRLLANVTDQDSIITNNPQGITSVGHHPQGAPAHMANLWTTYTFSIAGLRGFRVGAGLKYQDKSYSDLTNANSIPSFVIGNALVSYDRSHWGLSLNLDNFTDERYFIAANAAGAFVGESRTISVQAKWNIGSRRK